VCRERLRVPCRGTEVCIDIDVDVDVDVCGVCNVCVVCRGRRGPSWRASLHVYFRMLNDNRCWMPDGGCRMLYAV
jgi:hypothetical protein